jgi:hypothetical protein
VARRRVHLSAQDGEAPPTSFLSRSTDDAHSAPLIDLQKESNMSDDLDQTPPGSWTERGGMVPQQESAMDWAKEIAEAAYAREQGSKDKALEQDIER